MGVPKITQMAFPEVAQIRKGMPKRKNEKGYLVVGKDLDKYFRVAFAPGADEAKEQFKKLYPQSYKTFSDEYVEKDGFLVEKIRAVMPLPSIESCWQWANEAHNNGRMIAQADDTHYITLRDPLTGKYIVKNGEPYTPFNYGESITYENNGKTYTLPIRTVCRLKLFLPEMRRLVSFTLKSTSYYDRLNLDGQLQSIQLLANTFSNGNVTGVPFYIYRAEKEITWNKPDGSASRIKKWIINLEPDSAWVDSMLSKMSKFALGSGEIQNSFLLPGPGEPLETNVNPEVEHEEFDENDENVVTVTPEDTEPQFNEEEQKKMFTESCGKIIKGLSKENKDIVQKMFKKYEPEKGNINKLPLSTVKEAYEELVAFVNSIEEKGE